jgi:hypothetical protein
MRARAGTRSRRTLFSRSQLKRENTEIGAQKVSSMSSGAAVEALQQHTPRKDPAHIPRGPVSAGASRSIAAAPDERPTDQSESALRETAIGARIQVLKVFLRWLEDESTKKLRAIPLDAREISLAAKKRDFDINAIAKIFGKMHRADPESGYIDADRAARILGASVEELIELCQQRYLDFVFLISYRSVADFCDSLREAYEIEDRRPQLSDSSAHYRDEDLLPFSLNDTIQIFAAATALGCDDRAVQKLIDAGRIEGYRLAPFARWRISGSSMAAYERRKSAAIKRETERPSNVPSAAKGGLPCR